MFRNKLYYGIKPLLPARLRLGVRGYLARRARASVADVWPISPGSEKAPEGWPGWPEGKKFAVVLTHDTEGQRGLERIQKVIDLEKSLGFKSSFNLIPEGEYRVSPEIRKSITDQGFEVGVHDLYHNGKLFLDRGEFSKNAAKINEYLKEWGASGFRSGFMLHNLDWIHDLNVAYDLSTFDTDPFEPQPYGQHTIFPFWVPQGACSSKGYVELPYTLPQDSTLFLILKEKHPDIWIHKLDWIAKHGGMVVVNVHPDYIRFSGERANGLTYCSSMYERFLVVLRQKYSGQYWNPRPQEAASYARELALSKRILRQPYREETVVGQDEKRAAVVLYSGFPNDPRPRRELEALLEHGVSVDLICLHEDPNSQRHEQRGRLRITRVPVRHQRTSKFLYFWNYARFFLYAFTLLSSRALGRKYDLVHVHNMPDFLIFSALVPRLRGARLILDLHDPMPELYESIYGLSPNSPIVRILQRMEKACIGFADLVLTPNESFKRLFCSRSCGQRKVEIVMNTPDEQLFSASDLPVAPSSHGQEFRIMFHGLIAERHGLSTAVEALKILSDQVPHAVLDIYGGKNTYLQEVTALAERIGVGTRCRYQGKRPIDAIPAAISECNLGIIPNKRTPFTEINFPTRIFEYLCMGKPVIVPRTEGIRDYFDEESIIYFEPNDPEDLARKIAWVYMNPRKVEEVIARGLRVYAEHRWSAEKKKFLSLVFSLLSKDPGTGSGSFYGCPSGSLKGTKTALVE